MQRIGTLLLSGGIGACSGAFLSFVTFVVLSVFDSTNMDAAIGYGMIVGLVGGCVGLCIGIVVGICRLGILGGGIVGAFITLLLVLSYMFAIGTPGQYLYYLSESAIIVVVFAFPTIATGIITGLVRRIMAPA